MYSLILHLTKKIFTNNQVADNVEEDSNVENLLAQIENIRKDNETEDNVQINYVDTQKEGCFYKIGTVTLVHREYILIEKNYVCELKYVIPTNLKIGDKVHYLAYKVKKDDQLKICKVVEKLETDWDNPDNDSFNNIDNNVIEANDNIDTISSDKTLETRQISTRSIIGKVDKRKGRDIFLEDGLCINLDNVCSDFIPVIGDWIKLDSLVEVDENVANLEGEILEIKSISPLRRLNTLGKVTEYNNTSEYGVIDQIIVFTKAVCLSGYIPRVGDKVVVQSIESNQGIQYQWRALTVVPMEDVDNNFQTSILKFKTPLPEDEIKELIQDKGDIDITNDIKLDLDAKEEKEVEITIKNNSVINQTICKCIFISNKSESQLNLESPKDNQLQNIGPSEEIIYKFKCKARFVGVSKELVIFKFKKFKIGRIFQITVKNINLMNEDLTKNIISTYNKNCRSSILPKTFEDGTYIAGIKPYKPVKFISTRSTIRKIPTLLWTTVNTIIMEKKTRTESEFILLEKIPIFQQALNMQNYKQRFSYLLYLEEIAQIINIQQFTMSSVIMHRRGEFLSLNVPGLVEKRPSLIIGDKVLVSFKWDQSQGKKTYEGYIHKVKSADIYLKFHPKFQDEYSGEDCQVSFVGSTAVIQRCHTAIDVVASRLGGNFLFPKKVVQKKPQYIFVESDSGDENSEIIENSNETVEENIETILAERKLNWINKNLNKYQKEAVRNILKGLARPLPYIIFGPPGTGKTITLCEAILQIFVTISESRILIATPSNSSANLITLKLLDSKLLQPGDLIRVVAYHYIESDAIPVELIPYCATVDIAAEGTHSNVNILNPRGHQSSMTLSVLCRHRIIVGTCTALGSLYTMGCKPGHFTHIAIDEAGQASEPEIMIPLSLAHVNSTQVILAGDPKQLGPVNQSRLAGYFGLDDSFLVRLLQQFPYQKDPEGFETGYDPRLVTKLLINYRSLPDLLKLPNQLFYDSELIPQVDSVNSEEAALLHHLTDMLPKRLGDPPSIIFHGVKGTNRQDQDSPSWYNAEEATQVYIYLLDLYNHGLEPSDIGIITPYSKQVYRIKSLLAEFKIDIPKVGSVEEFQGQERNVIILSTVRTAEEKVKEDVKHALGFISARERLNVAITRSRALLIIIGYPELLQQDVYWRSVLQYCKDRDSCIGF